MSKWDKTQPPAGGALLSSPVRLNIQAIDEKLMGASANAQATPDMTVAVGAFVYLGSDTVTRKSYAGGNSPTLTAPSTNPRIALLTCDDAGSLAWTYGAEAGSPTAPNPPAGKVPICEVYSRVGMTSIKDADDSTNGFVQRQASLIVPVPKIQTIPYGQCRLVKSGANLVLQPYKGNLLTINSVAQAIPDAGVSLGVGGLAASTTYYIYAYMNAGTMTLEAVATTHATQAGTGVEIKSGDATRTLVGMARTTAGIAWADADSTRLVRSWFNDPGINGHAGCTANRPTASAVMVEVTTDTRIDCLLWANEVLTVGCAGTATGSVTLQAIWQLYDNISAVVIDPTSDFVTAATFFHMVTHTLKGDFGEGYHQITLRCATSAGTLTLLGGASGVSRVTTSLMARGH